MSYPHFVHKLSTPIILNFCIGVNNIFIALILSEIYTNRILYPAGGWQMREFDVPKSKCVCCGRVLNAAQSKDNKPARPGDVTICIHCGMIMQFGPHMELRRVTSEEMAGLRTSALWQEIVALQKKLNEIMDQCE
jgi:hypothetical protein